MAQLDALDGRYDIFIAEHNEILDESLPCIRRQGCIVFQQQCRKMRRKFRCFLGVTRRDLSDECDELSELLSVFAWICLKNLANTVVMVPLLQKFFLVGSRVPLDEVLQLREI